MEPVIKAIKNEMDELQARMEYLKQIRLDLEVYGLCGDHLCWLERSSVEVLDFKESAEFSLSYWEHNYKHNPKGAPWCHETKGGKLPFQSIRA